MQPCTPINAIIPAVPVGAVAPANTYALDHLEVTPRLPATLTHSSGSFSFNCYPDTGSGASLISSDLIAHHSIWMVDLIDDATFVSVNGEEIPVIGDVHATISLANSNVADVHFVVSPCLRNDVILRYKKLKELHVVNKLKEALVTEFKDVLTSALPKEAMVGGFMDIHLNDRVDVPPTKVTTARPVPLHFRKEADEVIEKALVEGIIARVTQPTTWCSPAFFVRKPNGGLRLVTDFTGLNKWVHRPIHPFPAPHSIVSGLDPSSRVIAKLDALSGYHQVALTDKASMLTCFLLPSGVYRYLRAPMGLSSLSDEFCRHSDTVFAGIPGVRKLVDDLLVEGKDMEDLEAKLHVIFWRCEDNGFILSHKKFEIGTSVELAGFIIDSKGISPSPKRLAAIADFPIPKDITTLHSFLGLCNQLAIFVPDLAALSSELRKLLKKRIVFQWLPDHTSAFNSIKHALVKQLAIHHFDDKLHTKLVTDASKLNGIGFILVQMTSADSDMPVSVLQCRSRSLTLAERNYAMIELECLAIQWALHKCHFFLVASKIFLSLRIIGH